MRPVGAFPRSRGIALKTARRLGRSADHSAHASLRVELEIGGSDSRPARRQLARRCNAASSWSGHEGFHEIVVCAQAQWLDGGREWSRIRSSGPRRPALPRRKWIASRSTPFMPGILTSLSTTSTSCSSRAVSGLLPGLSQSARHARALGEPARGRELRHGPHRSSTTRTVISFSPKPQPVTS